MSFTATISRCVTSHYLKNLFSMDKCVPVRRGIDTIHIYDAFVHQTFSCFNNFTSIIIGAASAGKWNGKCYHSSHQRTL